MAKVTPEQQEAFDEIIDEIEIALDPTESEPITAALKKLWVDVTGSGNRDEQASTQ